MSEAEFERLYQDFIRKNGGIYTGANTPTSNNAILDSLGETVNTPIDYYNDTNNIGLSPDELAELNATEEQFNRQQALSIISSEIAANNFTNPYLSVADNGISNYTAYSASPGVAVLNNMSGVFDLLSSAGTGGTNLAKSTILAGVLAQTNVKFEDILKGALLGGLAINMFNDLKNHSESQIQDLPQTLEDADTLSGLNKQFGQYDNSCSLFNDLMGIMSGSFDSAFDLLNNAKTGLLTILENTGIMDLFNNISSQVSGLISGIIGPITDNIDGLINGISGIVNSAIASAKSAFNNLTGGLMGQLDKLSSLASSALNAVSSVTNQIAKEIAGLTDMMGQITSKLKAIAMAGAMLDPCKLAVLLNTGSSELKNAASLLNSPLPVKAPNFSIPTEIDPRANKKSVDLKMSQAKSDASKSFGVPQSPFTSLSGIYQPINAYLFDLFDELTGIFNSNFETVVAEDGSPRVIRKPVTGSKSKTANSSQILPISQELPRKLSVPELDKPPSIDTLSGITRGLTTNLQDIVENVISPMNSVAASDAEVINTSDKEPVFDNEKKQLLPVTVFADAAKQWRKDILPTWQTMRKNAGITAREIQRYLDIAKFQNEDQKRQAGIIQEQLLGYEASLNALRKDLEAFKYTTPGGDKDRATEIEMMNKYQTSVKPKHLKVLNRTEEKINDSIRSWESIKVQTIYNGDSTLLG